MKASRLFQHWLSSRASTGTWNKIPRQEPCGSPVEIAFYRRSGHLTPSTANADTNTIYANNAATSSGPSENDFRGLAERLGQLREYTTLGSVSPATTPDWDRAVSDAEKIVGYSTSYFSLRCLLSDEISNIALHLRKLVGTNHPLLETAKRLTYTGHGHLQTRGLIVLLISKSAGHAPSSLDLLDANRSAGISQRQRSLAEIVEMIFSAQLIHRGILNLPPALLVESQSAQDLHCGNKVSVLSGDFLLASVWKGLGELRNTKVVEMITTAISDFMQGEFVGKKSKQGSPLPSPEGGLDEWEERSFLWVGSLIANSCQAALELAGHNEDIQQKAYQFGKNIALAWQAYLDLQPFTDTYLYPPGTPFDLASSPVVCHLLQDESAMDYIQPGSTGNVDYKKLHSIITSGSGVQKTRELLESYANEALFTLRMFEKSDATAALSKIIHALRDQ